MRQTVSGEARGAREDIRRPWYHVIPCQYGHIYVHGDDELGFASDKPGGVAKRVANLPFTRVTQSGDDGMNIVFDVAHFDEVAAIVKPRRKRILSDEHREKLVEAGRLSRFAGSETTQTNLERDLTVAGDI